MIAEHRAALAIAIAFLALGAAAAQQQDEGPGIVRPHVKPKPPQATLLVTCDLPCDWKLDGEAKGRIEALDSAKATIAPGKHIVVALTTDGLDRVLAIAETYAGAQTVLSLELVAPRAARLNTEQETKDREAQEKATREEATRQQDLRDHAGELFRQGSALYEQRRYQEAANQVLVSGMGHEKPR